MNYFGNTNFSVGVRRLFYAVTPNETSFEKLEDVPDYLNEVRSAHILYQYFSCRRNGVLQFLVSFQYSKHLKSKWLT